MNHYHVFFLVLKLAIVIQFVLVLANKESVDSTIYLITEILFKTAIGIYIEIYLFHMNTHGMLFEDKLVMSFGGGLLVFDAWFNDLPILLQKYNISTPFTSKLSFGKSSSG